jgi:hypothetical protein
VGLSERDTVWVLVDESVLISAFKELSSDGIPQIDTFPPADPAMPAATVLATAASETVRKAGIELVVDADILDIAIAALERADQYNPNHIDAFANEVRKKLVKDLDTNAVDGADHVPTFESVLDYWCPDVLVTVNYGRRQRYSSDPVAVLPTQWVRKCIDVVRHL